VTGGCGFAEGRLSWSGLAGVATGVAAGTTVAGVATLVAAITLFDWLWIFHNLRIHKRTRRRGRRAMPRLPITDFLGRKFTEQEDMLHRARYIEVSIIELADENSAYGHKLFRVSDTVPEE